MSAIAALKGYRTQFLYSLHYILSHQSDGYVFRLEGLEDLDVLDEEGKVIYVIQVKNLSKPVTLSDLLSDKRTSFIKRAADHYGTAIPMLVSFGPVSSELKGWKSAAGMMSKPEEAVAKKNGIGTTEWLFLKQTTGFVEVNEENIATEVMGMLKKYPGIDPAPTAENLLYWLQVSAEKQLLITAADLFNKIENIAVYLSERIAVSERYGIYLKPLHLTDFEASDEELLRREFYSGASARYEHIYYGLDVLRDDLLEQLRHLAERHRLVIIHGASGQGKSALAYRYVFDHASRTLVYELKIQEDVPMTREAILAIQAITRGLNLPALFLIHVLPSTTGWLRIVDEFANYPDVRFLVTVRNEDWFRAGEVGRTNSFGELELSLSEVEAEMIYGKLDAENRVMNFVDFNEAWISCGSGAPMLEFVYSLTQGDSLYNKLKQQVLQLEKEDRQNHDEKQIHLLKLISLADAFDSKVDIEKIKTYPGLQFMIEKFENEYLVKRSADKKQVTGLHPIRSEVLCTILFDEFTCYKKDYVLSCLRTIEDADVQIFLMLCFYKKVITPDEAVGLIKEIKNINWTFYRAAASSLMWAGLRNYVEENSSWINAAYDRFGEGGLYFIDIFHADTVNMQELLESLIDNEAAKQILKDINAHLSPKSHIFSYATELFNQIDLPHAAPVHSEEWAAMAYLLFWLKHIPNSARVLANITPEDFETAFQNLDTEVLAKLMQGMHFYSLEYDRLRLTYASYFLNKLREKYQIPYLVINEEISLHFVVDILKYDGKYSTHDRVLEIIDLVRSAFPEKLKYNTQAYGHQLNLFSGGHDESRKHIPATALLLDEWVALNAMIRKTCEYGRRPESWIEFNTLLDDWENTIRESLDTFIDGFTQAKKQGNFSPLVSIATQGNFETAATLTIPRSASDPLGLYVKTNKSLEATADASSSAQKEAQLTERYGKFFKNYRDYKTSIETFISQSGQIINDRLQNMLQDPKPIDPHLVHVSQTNLFDAIIKQDGFLEGRQLYFDKFNPARKPGISESVLFTTATIWKSFAGQPEPNSTNKLVVKENIRQLRNDFESRLLKACKHINREYQFDLQYVNDNSTGNLPVFKCNIVHTYQLTEVLRACFNAIHQIIGEPEYTSLKQLMLLRYFPTLHFLPLVGGRSLYNQWYEFPQYVVRDKTFESLHFFNLVPKTVPPEVLEKLNIRSWLTVIPRLEELQSVAAGFINLRMLVEHTDELRFFDTVEMDDQGSAMVISHITTMCGEAQLALQKILDFIADTVNNPPYPAPSDQSGVWDIRFWQAVIHLKDHIFPQPKGLEEHYEVTINMAVLSEWAERLATCTEGWGIFINLLQDKYIHDRDPLKL